MAFTLASSSGVVAILTQRPAYRSSSPLSHGQRLASRLMLTYPVRLLSSSSPGNTIHEDQASQPGDSLRERIIQLRIPNQSITAILDEWVEEGRKVTEQETREVAKALHGVQRYQHALEVLTWVQHRLNFYMLASDHALYLDLLLINCGLAEAEAYFEMLQNGNAKKAACLPLLRHYRKEGNVDRAEKFMVKLHNLGLLVTPSQFNEIMKIYMAGHQYEKVPKLIGHMKKNGVPLDVRSYNIWLSACAKISSISDVEKVFEEMASDSNIDVGWSTHVTMAQIYLKYGMRDKALSALRCAEEAQLPSERNGYLLMIDLYASLGNKDGILGVWESSKKAPGTFIDIDLKHVIKGLVRLGELDEAERVFRTWESDCSRYDIRLSNVLLEAYVRNRWMDKAEAFHEHTQIKGGIPNDETWEILMEGWISCKQMDKAIGYLKMGFPKSCSSRPRPDIILAIAAYFGHKGMVEDAMEYVKVLRSLDIIDLDVYKCFLITYSHAGKAPPDVLEMMEEDKIAPDEETLALYKMLSDNAMHTQTDKL